VELPITEPRCILKRKLKKSAKKIEKIPDIDQNPNFKFFPVAHLFFA
jgi:hypothetical protein